MGIQNKFKSMVTPAISEIQENFSTEIREINDCKTKIRESMNLLKSELLEALKSTAYMRPGRKKWEILKEESKNLLDLQSRLILKNMKKKASTEKYKEYKQIVEDIKEETEAEIETYINGQINYIIKRRRAILYEVIKILLGTTVGAMTAYYLQYYIL